MRQILVWDIPTRLFHGLLTTGIVCAFAIAQFAGESSSLFPFHSMLGVVIGAILVFRIAWGMIGTRYALHVVLVRSDECHQIPEGCSYRPW